MVTFLSVTTLYVIWPHHNAFQHKNAVPEKWKSQKVILIKVLLIGATIKVLFTGATMTDYRKNGKFWSKPYENEILIKPDR